MAFLDSQQVAFHRQQLMDVGCTVIKGVWDDDFTSEMRDWSNAIIDENPPDEKFRFQGSDIHVFTEERWDRRVHLELSSTRMPDANAARIIDHPTQTQVCKDMGFGLTAAQEWVIMLSKPPGGLQCYWHQDYINWNSPEALTPWSTVISFGYYLSDTNRNNGCLRVIPGSHRHRHELHDLIPPPHASEIQQMTDLSSPTFSEHPDAINIEVSAGDMVLVDARLLHSTWDNISEERRTLLLVWHRIFQDGAVPPWWDGELPSSLRNLDPLVKYEESKSPGDLLKPSR
jgi:hypothetical protein